jgi:hypothetical protein
VAPPQNASVELNPPAADSRRDRRVTDLIVLEKHGKALVICGAAHFYRTEVSQILLANGGGITKLLDADYPGRTLVVLPVRGPGPEFHKFERALATSVRPVLVSLQRPPFRRGLSRSAVVRVP